MKLTLSEIARVVGAKNSVKFDRADRTEPVGQIEFDSRQIKPGDIFLPLHGARDGHEFIATAFANGAIATFSEHDIDQPHFRVDDNLAAFQKLAAYYLTKMPVEVIGITGSNGKTTTKDMIAAVLAEKYHTYKTQGNHNNEIGAPYTILHMPENTEKLVLEMGMDHFGDIHFLSQLARPTMGVITLIGESHLEFMGSRERIAEGKMGLAAGLRPGAELLVPADPIINPYLPANQKITRHGPDSDIFITELFEHRDYLTFKTNFLDESLTIPVPGKFNATNAMLAAYVGLKFKVSPTQIKHALAQVQLTKNRTEWLKAANGADILSDVYNANPTAMKLILETFQAIDKNPQGRKIAVLADMRELGQQAPALHAGMAQSIDLNKLDEVYLYGPLMQNLADKLPSAHYFTDFAALTAAVTADLRPQDQILLKGSNSMHLADLVAALVKL